MLCPRCQEVLSAHEVLGAGARWSLDRCARCDGVWVDGSEVLGLLPQVAPALRPPSAAPRRAPLSACPRCTSAMTRLAYVDVDLDLCNACHGLWVDGDELEALARSDDRAAGHPAPAEGARDGAAGALRAAKVALLRCTSCGAEVPPNRSMLTAHGPLCEPCFHHGDEGDDPELAAFEQRLREGGGSHGDYGKALLAVGSFLVSALSVVGRCPRCNCHHHSHCHH